MLRDILDKELHAGRIMEFNQPYADETGSVFAQIKVHPAEAEGLKLEIRLS